jgi:hypothetical protein
MSMPESAAARLSLGGEGGLLLIRNAPGDVDDEDEDDDDRWRCGGGSGCANSFTSALESGLGATAASIQKNNEKIYYIIETLLKATTGVCVQLTPMITVGGSGAKCHAVLLLRRAQRNVCSGGHERRRF